MSLQISEMTETDLTPLKVFTDMTIGDGYYSAHEIQNIFNNSLSKNSQGQQRNCSFLLKDATGKILGMRFTYPPGNWEKGKGTGHEKGLTQKLWPYTINETAYFQSLFLAPEVQGQGWGVMLSQKSLEVLRAIGAKGVVCHSWKESPNNSSTRYLQKLGFQLVAEHPLYWKEIDYHCTRCGNPPCQCTALEMYLRLESL